MKKIISACCFFLVMSAAISHAQSVNRVNELAVLSKTWGLLKYYHPGIATGAHNWDSVLVASTASVLRAKDSRGLRTAIAKMLRLAGPDTEPGYTVSSDNPMCTRNYDMSWINTSSLLSASQKSILTFVSKHPYRGTNYYAQPNPNDDNAAYTPNEKAYKDMLMPDVNYRLLSLCRFWNFINYYYPYKYVIGKPWDSVLLQLIPVMIRANDTLSYDKTLAVMAASINDSHGGLWPQVFDTITGKYGPPFNFRLIDNMAVVTKILDSTALNNSKIAVGDVIEAMDGVSIKDKIAQCWNYIPASANSGKIRDMHGIILKSKSTSAVFTGYRRDGKRFSDSVHLIERNFVKEYFSFFNMQTTVTSKMVADGVGYVVLGNIFDKNIDSIMVPLMNAKAIIFDLRKGANNFSEIYNLPNYLLSKPAIYSRDTHPDYHLPGMFKYDVANKGTVYETVGKINAHPYQGKIILLVDERTQSVLEWSCMIVKTASNVTVIGRQTAGADGNVTRTILPGGYNINFSGLGIYYPDGTETQRKGIHADIPVNYTLSDFANDNDPVMKRAIEFANGK